MGGFVIIIGTFILLIGGFVALKSEKLPFSKKKLIILGILGIYSSIMISQKLLEPGQDK